MNDESYSNPNPSESQEEIETPGFLFYRETAYMFLSIRDETEAGRVINAAIAYFLFGETPPQPFADRRMRDAFAKLCGDIDRNGAKYRNRVRRNRENGKKGGRPKK